MVLLKCVCRFVIFNFFEENTEYFRLFQMKKPCFGTALKKVYKNFGMFLL